MKPINDNLQTTLTRVKTTILLLFRMVFSNPLYIAIAATVSTTFWIIFNVFDQLLFSPIVTFYLPDDTVTGFILTNITSVLMGIVVALNVYVIRNSMNLKLDKSIFSGSILAIASTACASSTSIGFLVISMIGGFGIITIDLLTNYQTPLRMISVVILLWALYHTHNMITKPCARPT